MDPPWRDRIGDRAGCAPGIDRRNGHHPAGEAVVKHEDVRVSARAVPDGLAGGSAPGSGQEGAAGDGESDAGHVADRLAGHEEGRRGVDPPRPLDPRGHQVAERRSRPNPGRMDRRVEGPGRVAERRASGLGREVGLRGLDAFAAGFAGQCPHRSPGTLASRRPRVYGR
jgi:hypothetical protein